MCVSSDAFACRFFGVPAVVVGAWRVGVAFWVFGVSLGKNARSNGCEGEDKAVARASIPVSNVGKVVRVFLALRREKPVFSVDGKNRCLGLRASMVVIF